MGSDEVVKTMGKEYKKMNVGELIDVLKKFDPSDLVLVSGYESGYESGISVSVKGVMEYKAAYCGDYDDYDPMDNVARVEAVVIERDPVSRSRGG